LALISLHLNEYREKYTAIMLRYLISELRCNMWGVMWWVLFLSYIRVPLLILNNQELNGSPVNYEGCSKSFANAWLP